ncbi:MAG: hypothetical protein HFG64_10100 [Lachnospiraceae bacterium]|nr:hypothetical protein [Lachnospiraceae bacterium]
MNDWKYSFSSHILERGIDYYEAGAVGKLQKTESGYKAWVEGTRDYQVEIDLADGGVETMWCSCPYAADGNNCKHMAAVLLAIEDELEEDGEFFGEPEDEDGEISGNLSENSGKDGNGKGKHGHGSLEQELEAAIGRIPEKELRELVKELAGENEGLQNRILTQYASGVSPRQMARLKKELENIVYRNSDRHGFVGWQQASGYVRDIERFLDQQVGGLIGKGCLMEAFELVNAVFIQVGNVDIDDSGGETGILANSCYEYWQEILENCGDEEKKKLFVWFEKNQNAGIVIDYLEEYIQNFLYDEFHDQGLLQQKLAALDEELGDGDFDEPVPRSRWGAYGNQADKVLKRLEIMEELGASQEEIQAWKRKYWTCPSIRDMQLEEYLEAGRLKEGVALLKESKELDQDYSRLVGQHSKKLIGLYQRLGMNREYKEELIFQISGFYQGSDLEFVKQLKKLCTPEEWASFREKILQDEHEHVSRYGFLAYEGMYDELLEAVLKSNSAFNMDQYEKLLGGKFPEQVRDFYAAYVRGRAESASSRSHYQELVKYLKRLCKYPDGKKLAEQIAGEWKTAYRRRPAMQDELRKGGFV